MPLVCCLCFAFSCAFQFYAAMCFQVGCASHWPMGRTVATCADVSSPRGHVMHCADVSTGELTWPLESERGPQLISPAPLALLCRGHCHSSCVREYTDLRHQGQVLHLPPLQPCPVPLQPNHQPTSAVLALPDDRGQRQLHLRGRRGQRTSSIDVGHSCCCWASSATLRRASLRTPPAGCSCCY